MQEKNDAQNEDEPRCCKALQGDGSGKNSLFKVECKPYPDQKDIQKEAETSKVRCYRQEQQGYGETINSVRVNKDSRFTITDVRYGSIRRFLKRYE